MRKLERPNRKHCTVEASLAVSLEGSATRPHLEATDRVSVATASLPLAPRSGVELRGPRVTWNTGLPHCGLGPVRGWAGNLSVL